MNINILFFAAVREALDCEQLQFESNDEVLTLAAIKSLLSERGQHWQQVFADKQLMQAVNQNMTHDDAHRVVDGDTVAFFPPVTGG